MAGTDENIEAQLEEEFSDVGVDIEGNLVILEKCEYRIYILNFTFFSYIKLQCTNVYIFCLKV